MQRPAGLTALADLSQRVSGRVTDRVTERLADPLGRRPHLERPASPRVLVVTGASSGIGRAVAHEAAALGDHLVLAARSDESLEEVARECTERGAASTLVVPTDVGDDDAVAALVERTLTEQGRVDAVVNSAGVVAYGPAEEVPR